ncbi:MAG TPA: TonB family protein [Geobacteraceae bacterium]|nr:TonB family protein [Geobacteraceae bacterium]
MEQPITTHTLLRQRKSVDIFAIMVLISLLLHGVLSFFFLMPARTMVQGRQPLFVDLQSMPAVSSPAVAPQSVEPDTTPEPEVAPPQNQEPLSQTESLQKSVSDTLKSAAVTPGAVHQSSIGLGITSGYFGSFAEGETLRDEIREYYFTLMRRINEVWWTHSASNPALRGASFILVVSREGKVVACNLIESSGNPQNDQMLQETVKLAEPLPPFPASFPDQLFNAPIRFVPPLNLMVPGLLRKPVSPH